MTTGSDRPSAGRRVHGTLTTWKDDRGFGFITPVPGGPSVFVHISAFPSGLSRPLLGEQVTFEAVTDSRGKTQATRVEPVNPKLHAKRAPRNQSVVSYLAILAFIALYISLAVRWNIPYWVIALYLGASLVCFFVYAADKTASTAGRWRTSESRLLALGLIGGWPGAIFAQQRLRHKTKKISFQLAFWGTVVLNVIAFVTFTSPMFRSLF
jgi:uncharacterized membrane protein YsdA (DUF1294 family)/cold shock CspA family protein